MKRTIISIGLTLAILPNLAFANSIRVKPHDDLLDISGRHERGTLHADVQRSQSFYQYTPEFCALIPDNAGDSVREEDVRGCREHRRMVKNNYGQLVDPSKSFLAQLACFLSKGTSNRCPTKINPYLQTAN